MKSMTMGLCAGLCLLAIACQEETFPVRKAKGKPAEALVRISLSHFGTQVVRTRRTDGLGLKLDAVLAAFVVSSGMVLTVAGARVGNIDGSTLGVGINQMGLAGYGYDVESVPTRYGVPVAL